MISKCWCGSETSGEFGPDYRCCPRCHTLVYAHDFNAQEFEVKDDEADFYGKNYWMKHQQENFGYSDFETRSRADLTERNLFWLKALLELVVPPGKVLELGCAHGSFVALLKQSGFDAMGLEMSPWVVDYGRRTFNIEVLEGPIETHAIPEGSFDAIVLMDVIEHLPNPKGTMAHCLGLLKPEGILLIQTPDYRPEMIYEDLVKDQAAFLEQLKPREHLFLFSPSSIMEFFKELGADHQHFFPAIFDQYDMFLAVSRRPLRFRSEAEIQSALQSSSGARVVRALLDVYEKSNDSLQKLGVSEADREARFEQIRSLTKELKATEADRATRFEQIQSLTEALKISEADRAARFEQIKILTEQLTISERDRQARFDQVEMLTLRAQSLEEHLDALRGELRPLIQRQVVRRLLKLAGFDEVERLIELTGEADD